MCVCLSHCCVQTEHDRPNFSALDAALRMRPQRGEGMRDLILQSWSGPGTSGASAGPEAAPLCPCDASGVPSPSSPWRAGPYFAAGLRHAVAAVTAAGAAPPPTPDPPIQRTQQRKRQRAALASRAATQAASGSGAAGGKPGRKRKRTSADGRSRVCLACDLCVVATSTTTFSTTTTTPYLALPTLPRAIHHPSPI
jgi:hypothetical protein